MNRNIKKDLPHNEYAEESVIIIILQNPNLLATVKDNIYPDDFYNKKYRVIYQAILNLDKENKKIGSLSVFDEIKLKNKGNIKIERAELEKLENSFIDDEKLDEFLHSIKDKAVRRKIAELGKSFTEKALMGDDATGTILDSAEEEIYELSKRRSAGDFIKLPEITEDLHKKTEAFKSGKQSVSGLHSGFEILNHYTSGFHPEELIIIAARPSVGKSAFALNLANNIAVRNLSENKNGVIAFFSLEMSNEQIVSRLISSNSGIDGMLLRSSRKFSQEQWVHFNAAIEDINKLKIVFDDSGSSTISSIRAKCRKLSELEKLDLIIIDYLQLVRDDRRKYMNEQEEISEVSRGLKQLARELKIPVIALSQLSRRADADKDKRPRLSYLRGSGSIEQDADIVMFLHRPDYEKDEDEESSQSIDTSQASAVELYISKNRQGMTGKLDFVFERNLGRFTERDNQGE